MLATFIRLILMQTLDGKITFRNFKLKDGLDCHDVWKDCINQICFDIVSLPAEYIPLLIIKGSTVHLSVDNKIVKSLPVFTNAFLNEDGSVKEGLLEYLHQRYYSVSLINAQEEFPAICKKRAVGLKFEYVSITNLRKKESVFWFFVEDNSPV